MMLTSQSRALEWKRQRRRVFRKGDVAEVCCPSLNGAVRGRATVLRVLEYADDGRGGVTPMYLVHLHDSERTLKVVPHETLTLKEDGR
jgi:hypothetical protein